MAPQPQHGSTTIEIPNVTFTRTSLASHVKPTGGGETTTAKCAMACDGIVFDTTSGRDFYGPGGPYAALNGRDASRALAMMKINVSEEEEALGVEGLSEDEVKTLREWRVKFEGKYPALGRYERGG
jgi:membrane-associated progesterone receptor component